MHEHGVVLRNLEASGILMTETNDPENAVPRISRIDRATIGGIGQMTIGAFGDVRYCSPEVVMGKRYNHKSDVWSFGVILFLITTKKYPFEADGKSSYSDGSLSLNSDNVEEYNKVIIKEVEDKIINYKPNLREMKDLGISNLLLDLMRLIFKKDPKARPSISEVLQHQWFK